MSAAKRVPAAIRATVIGLFVLAGSALVVLGPRSATELPDDRVVVVYWEKWTDFEGAAMHALVRRFNETTGREKGVYVEYVPTTGIDLKTLVAIAGGDPPDLAGLWQRNLHSFAASGALEPLDARVRRSGLGAGTILPALEDGCRYHGVLYAVPLTPATIALYYNKDILAVFAGPLREAGLDPERPPRTIAELDAYADILCRRNPQGEIELMAYLPGAPDTFSWFWHTWPVWFGGRLYDSGTGEFRVDAESFVEAYTWVQSFVRRFGVHDVARFESSLGNFSSPDNPFMSGRLAMVLQGPWFANMIRKFAPEIAFGVAPFPTIDGRELAYFDQDILAIPHGAAHPDEAWAFVEWLYSQEPILMATPDDAPELGYDYYEVITEQGVKHRPMPLLRPIEWLCWVHCKNSPLLDPTPAFLTTHPNPAIALHERLARSPDVVTIPPLPNWVELHREFAAAYRDILRTGIPAAGRLEQCQRRLDRLTQLARRRMSRYGLEYP